MLAFYIPENGHMVGRNTQEFVVCIKLILIYLRAFVGTIVVNVLDERTDHESYNAIIVYTANIVLSTKSLSY
jgi:hypothetical protein